MDLSAIQQSVQTELELLGRQTPRMLDRTLKPSSNDATSEPARHHDRCTALSKHLLALLSVREEFQVKKLSLNTGSGEKSEKDLYLHVEFKSGAKATLTFEVQPGLGWYLGVSRIMNAKTKERPALTPDMITILHGLAVQEGHESRDYAMRLFGPYLRQQGARLLQAIEEDSELATALVLRGVFRDDIAAAYDNLLPTGDEVIDVAAVDASNTAELPPGHATES